jgi:hypothetical protein
MKKKIRIIREGTNKSWFNSHLNEIFEIQEEDDWCVHIIYNNERVAIGKKCIVKIEIDDKDIV